MFPPARRRPARWRTSSGRLTRIDGNQAEQIAHAGLYFPVAVTAAAIAGASAALLGGSKFAVGYAIYGTITVAFLIVPNSWAFWRAKDVPFPTLFTTLDHLDQRWHPAVMIIVAGIAVLVVHLAAYPWP